MYLAEYMKDTYQSFRVRTNNTVTSRNNKIRSSGSKQPLLPAEWENYGKTFICTHSGKYKSRGKGKRKGCSRELWSVELRSMRVYKWRMNPFLRLF
ncbi:hypothetical protein PC128_g26303 [Phytophthora cactorum]|nr:hypothetical protein PC117_g26447 [Phytophthora cactorum]KAG3133728.1 hypothetical protein PC128_g26303 [Phytophthora cactorum]